MGFFDKVKDGVSKSAKEFDEQVKHEQGMRGDPCPECGHDEYGSGVLSTGIECLECGESYTREEVNLKRSSFGSSVDEDDLERAEELAANAEHTSVTPDILAKSQGYLGRYGSGDNLLTLLDEDEQPHIIFRGNSVDVEGGGDNSSRFGNDRSRKMNTGASSVITLVTDRRVIIYVPQLTGNDQRNIPYDSITGVDMDSGIINKRLTIQTHGRTYHMSGFESGQEVLRKAMEFIRRARDEANTPQSDEGIGTPDPLDQLERLRDLHAEGVVSDEEFETKKRDLLDQI